MWATLINHWDLCLTDWAGRMLGSYKWHSSFCSWAIQSFERTSKFSSGVICLFKKYSVHGVRWDWRKLLFPYIFNNYPAFIPISSFCFMLLSGFLVLGLSDIFQGRWAFSLAQCCHNWTVCMQYIYSSMKECKKYVASH